MRNASAYISVEDHTGLVYMVVGRFLNRGYEKEELIQVGMIGLLQAAKNYDPQTGYSFSTFAVPWIMGEIRRFLRDDGEIHICRSIKENARKIAVVRERYAKTENREPSIAELKSACGLSEEEIMEAAGAMNPELLVSRDAVEVTEKQVEQKESCENLEDTVINKVMVQQLMEKLDEKERRLIYMRYYQGKTQCQVAKVLGVNQVKVSRMEKAILCKLRK